MENDVEKMGKKLNKFFRRRMSEKAEWRFDSALGNELIDDRHLSKRRYKPWLPSPPNLKEYSGDVVNRLPMPVCWNWTSEEVADWLSKTVRLPQYRDCMLHNCINGRRLLLLENFGLQQCGITDFKDMQTISAAIRKLFGVEKVKKSRSIGLPERHPWTHYLLYRVPTGPKREATTPFELFQKMGIIDQSEDCPFGHWQMIEPAWKDFPVNRFGFAPRKSVYRRLEHPRQIGHSYLAPSKIRANFFLRRDLK